MTPEVALAAIAETWKRIDPLTEQLSDNITEALANPAFPMLMRCMAMGRVIAGAAEGLFVVTQEDGAETINLVHMVETLPDLIIILRASADLFEAANKVRQN